MLGQFHIDVFQQQFHRPQQPDFPTSTTTVKKLLGSANVRNIDRPFVASHQDCVPLDNKHIQTGQYRTGERSDRAARFSETYSSGVSRGVNKAPITATAI